MRIHITGASGSGTTTLGTELARRLELPHFDSDRYYWHPTSPPYQARRTPPERLAELSNDLGAHEGAVLSGSIVGWGPQVEDAFDLVVFLYLPAPIRVERLRTREEQEHGHADPLFLEWAALYDEGPPNGRSLAKHNAWLASRRCPVLRLEANESVESRIAHILIALSNETIPLPSGRITAGIVRMGSTVRRPRKSSSDFTGRLLTHLEACGFAGAPRYLGRDERGRDMLTYIPGEVATFRRFSDAQLAAAGALLRAFHDTTRGSELAGDQSVVCHHDTGPNNFVFQGGLPVALIDFDTAAPGEPLEDLGYMAWLWCVSSKDARQPVSVQAAQVRALLDAYELDGASRANLIDAMLVRQWQNAQFWRDRLVDRDGSLATVDQIHERIAWSLRERAFTEAHRSAFERTLGIRAQR